MDPIFVNQMSIMTPQNVNPDAAPRIVPADGPESLADTHPLRPIVAQWQEKLKLAANHKRAVFGDVAADCMRFFDGPYDFLYQKDYKSATGNLTPSGGDEVFNFPAPSFQMTCNRAAEMEQLFGPSLYFKNPVAQVNPRKFSDLPIGVMGQDPMMAMMEQSLGMQSQQQALLDKIRASILQAFLNYLPTEMDMVTESRGAINEGLIKGRGLLWIEPYKPINTTNKLVGAFFESVDGLLVDPDAESLKTAKWVARRKIQPVWEAERRFKLPQGSLKGNYESIAAQASYVTDPDFDYARKQGRTSDLIVYFEIYSKLGVGGRLNGIPTGMRQVLDQFGDFCYLVIAENHPFPLNVPPSMMMAPGGQQQILKQLEWPTPFWADAVTGGWPFAPFDFHPVARRAWPMAHLKTALGELKFLNWAISFLASRMQITCRDFLAWKKSVGEEMKNAITHGRDMTIIELSASHPDTIDKIVSFLSHPQVNNDIWKVIELINQEFDKRTGLSELMYGQSARQMRSAEEANLKGEQISIRPDDMANRVEETMTLVFRKLAIAARWHLTSEDVKPIIGPLGAYYWSQLVETMDPFAILHQLEYRIEAGSTRKPNRDRDADNMNKAMQNLFAPMLQDFQATGSPESINALINDWARSLDMDATPYLFKPRMMMPPPAPTPSPGKSAEPDDKGDADEQGQQGRQGPPPAPAQQQPQQQQPMPVPQMPPQPPSEDSVGLMEPPVLPSNMTPLNLRVLLEQMQLQGMGSPA